MKDAPAPTAKPVVPTLALYQIADHYLAAFHELALRDDLPPEVIADTLEAVQGEFHVKAVNVVAYAMNCEAEAEMVKAAAKRMTERAKALENRAKALRAYTLREMNRVGIPKVSTAQFAISIRKNPPALELDPTIPVPPFYLKEVPPPPPEPDTAAIKAALLAALKSWRDANAGKPEAEWTPFESPIPGARLVQGERLHID